MKIALLNDTRVDPNPGCQATVTALARRLTAATRAEIACLPRGWGYEHFARLAPAGGGNAEREWHAAVDRLHADTRLVSVLRAADLVVANLEGTFHHHTTGALALGGAMALAHRLGKPLWAVNGTAQAIEGWLLDATLRHAAHVAVREPRSAAWLSRHGIGVTSAADCAFLVQPFHRIHTPRRGPAAPRRRALYTPGILACLDGPARIRVEDVLAQMTSLRRHGFDPVYLQMDIAHEATIARGVRAQGWETADASDVAWHAFGRYLQQYALLVSGRYHLLIFAALAGVPFIPLASNSWKIDGLMDLLRIDAAIPHDTPTLDAALAATPDGHRAEARVVDDCCRLAGRHVPPAAGGCPATSIECLDMLPDSDLNDALAAIHRHGPERFETTIDLAPSLVSHQHVEIRSREAWRARLRQFGLEIASEHDVRIEAAPAGLEAPAAATPLRSSPLREPLAGARWCLTLSRGAMRTTRPDPHAMHAAPADGAAVPRAIEYDQHTVFLVTARPDVDAFQPLWARLPAGAFTVVLAAAPAEVSEDVERWCRSQPCALLRLAWQPFPWRRFADLRCTLLTGRAEGASRPYSLLIELGAARRGWRVRHAGSAPAPAGDAAPGSADPEVVMNMAEAMAHEVGTAREENAALREELERLRAEHYWLGRIDAEKTGRWLRRHPAPLRVALFGASSLGATWARRLHGSGRVRLQCFMDNDPAKRGGRLEGLDILEPCPATYAAVDAIAITSAHAAALIVQVAQAGVGHKLVTDPEALLEPLG